MDLLQLLDISALKGGRVLQRRVGIGRGILANANVSPRIVEVYSISSERAFPLYLAAIWCCICTMVILRLCGSMSSSRGR